MRAQESETAKVRAIAREYRRQGYMVRHPSPGDVLPEFLQGMTPDLIAEREDDRVVVEVKASRSLRGDNQLKAMAERISTQPGWRFELVTTAKPVESQTNQAAIAVTDRIEQTFELGYGDAAFLVAYAMAEELLRDVASRTGVRARDWSTQRLAHALVTRGELSRKDYETLVEAQRWRDRFVHGRAEEELPSRAAIERLVALGQALRELSASEAGTGHALDRAA